MNKFKQIFDKIIKQDIGDPEEVDSKTFWEDDGGTGEHDEESSEDKSKKRPSVKEKSDSKKDKTAASTTAKEPIAKDKKKPVKAKADDEESKPIPPKDNPNEYPKKVSRRRGLLKKDERHIIIKQLEKISNKQSIKTDLERAMRKIERINRKLAAGQEVTVEDREFIRSLRHII